MTNIELRFDHCNKKSCACYRPSITGRSTTTPIADTLIMGSLPTGRVGVGEFGD